MDSRSWFDLGEYSNEANRINPEFAVLENLQRCAPHFHVFQWSHWMHLTSPNIEKRIRSIPTPTNQHLSYTIARTSLLSIEFLSVVTSMAVSDRTPSIRVINRQEQVPVWQRTFCDMYRVRILEICYFSQRRNSYGTWLRCWYQSFALPYSDSVAWSIYIFQHDDQQDW